MTPTLPTIPAPPLPATAPMIALDRASRWHGQVIGLNDVSCQIGPGLTALLGPNGAGKSTLLKLITGQLRPTTGTVRVMGETPFANARVLRQLGYCPENDNFYEEMTGREFVSYLGSMSGYGGKELTDRVARVIERVGMTDRCDRRLAGYSKGMRQRIKVAQAIIHDPRVLVMDEPLNGLDPVGRRDMVDLMTSLAHEGVCVLVSSHILYEVEQLTDNILLMQRGRLLARGSVEQIRGEMDSDHANPRHIVLHTDRPRALAAALFEEESVLGVHLNESDPTAVDVETKRPRQFYERLPEIVLNGEFTVDSVRSPDDHLEAIIRILLSRK